MAEIQEGRNKIPYNTRKDFTTPTEGYQLRNGSYYNNENDPNGHYYNTKYNGQRKQYPEWRQNNRQQYNTGQSFPLLPQQILNNFFRPQKQQHIVPQQQQQFTAPQFQFTVHVFPQKSDDSSSSNKIERNDSLSSSPTDSTHNTVVPLVCSSLSSTESSEIVQNDQQLTNLQHTLDMLSKAIWEKFKRNQQSLGMYRKKIALWEELYEHIEANHAASYSECVDPFFSVQIVGSTMSGFGTGSSDIDICLVISKSDIGQNDEALRRLHDIQLTLENAQRFTNIDLIPAKVPILKFRDISRGLDVDLNCNNIVGIRNTYLLSCYSQLDWRVKPLVLITKLWAKRHGINDAKTSTISSYSLVLMVIHYLQCGCEPKVLPCLQSMYPTKFSPSNDIGKIQIKKENLKWKRVNQMNMGELLTGFLHYFSNEFDFSKQAISVRSGKCIPKWDQSKFFIEEPFFSQTLHTQFMTRRRSTESREYSRHLGLVYMKQRIWIPFSKISYQNIPWNCFET